MITVSTHNGNQHCLGYDDHSLHAQWQSAPPRKMLITAACTLLAFHHQHHLSSQLPSFHPLALVLLLTLHLNPLRHHHHRFPPLTPHHCHRRHRARPRQYSSELHRARCSPTTHPPFLPLATDASHPYHRPRRPCPRNICTRGLLEGHRLSCSW